MDPLYALRLQRLYDDILATWPAIAQGPGYPSVQQCIPVDIMLGCSSLKLTWKVVSKGRCSATG